MQIKITLWVLPIWQWQMWNSCQFRNVVYSLHSPIQYMYYKTCFYSLYNITIPVLGLYTWTMATFPNTIFELCDSILASFSNIISELCDYILASFSNMLRYCLHATVTYLNWNIWRSNRTRKNMPNVWHGWNTCNDVYPFQTLHIVMLHCY